MKYLAITLILLISTNGIFAKPISKKSNNALIKRKVLILDFVNTQNSENYTYLEKSIPDAFLDPLDKTKSFELLSRSLWKKLRKKHRFHKNDANDEEKAIKAGMYAPSDVVVIGSFAVIGNKIQINSRAIELSSKRVIVSRSVTSKLTGNLFGAITKLSNNMAKEMKKKLPPLPQRVIIKERGKYMKGEKITTAGIIIRNLAIPGWGHRYSNRNRGWVYTALWIGGVGFLGYSIFDETEKKTRYENGTASDDLDTMYNEYNEAHKLTYYAIYGLIGVYSVALLDGIIFRGKKPLHSKSIFIPVVGEKYQGFMYRTKF